MAINPAGFPTDAETGGMGDIIPGRKLKALRDGIVDVDSRVPAVGRATFSGNGTATAFTTAHGLGAVPSSVVATPGSAAAAAVLYVTADATNLTVTFSAAPATGTNNVVLNWMAAR